MKEPCYFKLKFNFKDVILPDWKFPDTEGKDLGIWNIPAVGMFRPEWITDMHRMGIYVAESLVFYRAPGFNTGNAHIDIHQNHPRQISTFGLNFVLKGAGSEMTWFDTPTTKPQPSGGGKITYLSWPESELKELDRGHLDEQMSLVRIGVPHNVIMKDEERWCISVRSGTTERMYWKDIVKFMRDKDLLIERQPVDKTPR